MTGQHLRIFISSTFRDMQEEREELVKNVYPQLKHFCMQRGIFLTIVDLRWGITAEQAQEERTIAICLHEIDRCRPYFVCLMGERYGWVPPRIPEAALKEFPWLADRPGTSITEMEIRHGALNDPARGRAFFYLRNPTVADTLPGGRQVNGETDEHRVRRLASLREEIIAMQSGVVRNYDSAKAVAEDLLKDLEQVIESEFPVQPLVKRKGVIGWHEIMGQPDKPQGTPPETYEQLRLRERMFIGGLLPGFVGREAVKRSLDEFVAGPDQVLVITAPEGGGKSALIAHWSEGYRVSHPDVALIVGYVAHPTSELITALQRMAFDLNARHGLGHKVNIGYGEPRFATIFRQAAAREAMVVVVDGIDQDPKDPSEVLQELISELPPRTKLLLTSRAGALLEQLRKHGVRVEELPGLSSSEQRELTVQYLALYGKSLSDGELNSLLKQPKMENPRFLRSILDELRIFGRFEGLGAILASYSRTGNKSELYQGVLARLESDFAVYPGDRVQALFRYLWGAQTYTLAEEDLGALLELAQLDWSELLHAVGSLMVENAFGLVLRDDELRATVEERYLASTEDRRATHLRLAHYALNHPKTGYVRRAAHHLFCAEAWSELRRALLDDKLPVFGDEDLLKYWAVLGKHYDLEAEYLALANRLAEQRERRTMDLLQTGLFLKTAGHIGAAEKVLRQGVAVAAGKDDALAALLLRHLSMLLGEGERWIEAIETAQRMVALCDQAYERVVLATCEFRAGRYREAEENLLRALEASEHEVPRDEKLNEFIHDSLGRVREALEAKS